MAFNDDKEKNQALQFFWNENNTIIDIDTHFYIRNLAQKLLTTNYDFFVMSDASVNAFATEFGLIGINKGLVNLTKNESELASVVAHEIAHIKLEHFARFRNKNEHNNLIVIGGLLLAAISQNSEVSQALFTGTLATSTQLQINFTRSNEIEADDYGKQLLNKSEFDNTAMSSFFGRLKDDKNALEFLRSHPLSINRVINNFELKPSDSTIKHNSSFEYQILKAKFNKNADELLTNNKLKIYIQALKYFELKEYLKTIKILEKLDNDAANILKGKSFAKLKNIQQALKYLNKNNYLHRYYVAWSYFINNQYPQALAILKKQNYKQPSFYNYDLIAKINLKRGNNDKYHYNKGLGYLLTGFIKTAKEQFMLAKNITQNQDLLDILAFKISKIDRVLKSKL